MCPPRCPVPPVKTDQELDFSGYFEDVIGRVLGHVPGRVQNSSFGTSVLRGQVQLLKHTTPRLAEEGPAQRRACKPAYGEEERRLI